MEKFLNNIQLEQVSKNIYDFFIKYKSIILITFFVGVVVNAIDIFTIKFGVDSEFYAITNSPKIYFEAQRYGSWLLYHIFPFARYHIISQIIGIFALTLAALLTVSRHNISNNTKLLFMLLFVTYPNFAFLQYFYFQSAYNFIGLLFTVIAYRLIEKNNILAYIIAVILLLIGISSYQTNTAVYLSVVMINITLEYINEKNIKNTLKNIVKPVLLLIVTLIIYYILIKIFNISLNSYHSDFIKYNSSNIFDTVSNLVTYIYRILISYNNNAEHTANVFISIISLISLIYILIKHYREKYYLFFILLVVISILSFFSLNILVGGFIHSRAELAFAFYPAFILLLIFILNKNKYMQSIVIVLALFIIGYHTTYIVKYHTSYYLSYKHDETTAINLINKIYNKYPDIYSGKYNINFVGAVNSQPKHPLIGGKDVFTGSLFFWDNGNSDRILNFMRLHGFPVNIMLGEITDNTKEKLKTMPSYPNNDCIQLFDNTVVVKLSE